jgi:predicted phage baseplate assembly protein
MSKLAPNLFQRRFQDLMEIGRARLPSLAPEWTDYNAHDPGITLMELLAWVAEGQLYSLSRLRRDERSAYAALLGLTPSGTQAATGLIWPDSLDPNSPAATFKTGIVIPENSVINVIDAENPTFRPSHALLWAPGRIEKLETRNANGRTIDHTITNERGGLPFMPFGERTGRREVLKLAFACRDRLGLFGQHRENTKGALWPIGVIVAPPLGGAVDDSTDTPTNRSPLAATLVAQDERFALRIASDSTQGLLSTGTILLDLDNVTSAPSKLRKFTIELRSPSGFARPPRVLRLEPNVIPVLQGRTVSSELHVSNGMPDWSFALDVPGLRFASGQEPVNVQVEAPAGLKTWRRSDRLAGCGPDDEVYEFDAVKGEVTFGNGVNGRIPPQDSQVLVTYSVSDGPEGNVARNRKWKVTGVDGALGVNPDPITGGSASSGWIDDCREARRRSRDDHALVSSDDIETAAKALPLMEVARAWVPRRDDLVPRTGVVTVVVLRSRAGGKEPEQPPETDQWLDSIRRSLTARMPLASRLVVVAPRYVEFSIQAVLEAEPNRNPSDIKKKVEAELQKRLALVDASTGIPPRQPGVPVTSRDVTAWMRATDGVKRVVQLVLSTASGKSDAEVSVPRTGLPRWNSGSSTIDVQRPKNGGLR